MSILVGITLSVAATESAAVFLYTANRALCPQTAPLIMSCF